MVFILNSRLEICLINVVCILRLTLQRLLMQTGIEVLDIAYLITLLVNRGLLLFIPYSYYLFTYLNVLYPGLNSIRVITFQ